MIQVLQHKHHKISILSEALKKLSKYRLSFYLVIHGILLFYNAFADFQIARIAILLVIALLIPFTQKRYQFIRDWYPLFVLFFVYDTLRGVAFSIGAGYLGRDLITTGLIELESNLFFFLPELPVVFIQNILRPIPGQSHWYDYVLFLFYVSFFFYWIIVGVILWIKDRSSFYLYGYGLFGFSVLGILVFFFLFPTAPPWWAAEQGLMPEVERVLWNLPLIKETIGLVPAPDMNLFAAVPSYHAAWPMFSTLFMIRLYGKKALWLLIIPITVAFATWYGAEHYVVDSLLGFLLAIGAYIYMVRYGEKLMDDIDAHHYVIPAKAGIRRTG